MKQIIKFLIFIIALTLTITALANNSFEIPAYYGAKCENMTGVWKGFYTDPSDLFGGKTTSWPITISFLYRDGKLIGTVKGDKAISISGQLWANCKSGSLTQVFVKNNEACGHYGEGAIVSKKVLLMKVPYENAMNGTDFLVVLRKVGSRYPYAIPKDLKAFDLAPVQTCH